MRRRKTKAFTLIELLVVISIIAMLMSIMLPSLGRAREHGRRAACMANLRSIGQALYIYANSNDDRLVPGDYSIAWDVWAYPTEIPPGCSTPSQNREVNLGHLLAAETLSLPYGGDHVFFCPSAALPTGGDPRREFPSKWGTDDQRARITYMFNNSLDGFETFIPCGDRQILAHQDQVNFLLGDGSVQVFKIRPVVFDVAEGAEMLHEVCARYGVNFPQRLLHEWFEKGRIDLDEAKAYLSNPSGWMAQYSTSTGIASSKQVFTRHLAQRSIAADIVGVWDDNFATDPIIPGGPPPRPVPG